jgi:hypothetical protein
VDLTEKKSARVSQARAENIAVGCPPPSPTLAATAVPTSAATAAAVAATAAAVAAATAAIAAATAAIATTAAAAATWACFTRARFVYGQGPAFDGLAIELGDRFLRIGFVGHGDKGETARFAGRFGLSMVDFEDDSRVIDDSLKNGFVRIEGKILRIVWCPSELFFN